MIVSALIVIAIVAVMPAMLGKDNITTPVSNSAVPAPDTAAVTTKNNETPDEVPGKWVSTLNMLSYRLIEIEEVDHDDRNIILDIENNEIECVKAVCRVLKSYFDNGIMAEGGIYDLYLPVSDADEIAGYDMVLLEVEKQMLNYDTFNSVKIGFDGRAEYVPVIDDKLTFKLTEEEMYDSRFFHNIYDLNFEIETLHKYHSAEEIASSELESAIPGFLFEDGMSVQKMDEYFRSWERAGKIANNDSYYTDDGTYVRENVRIDSSYTKTTPLMPKDRSRDNVTAIPPLYTPFEAYFDDWNIPEPKDGSWHFAVVRKVGSVSCYKEYDDGKATLAYTISDLEITDLPSGCTHYKVGDIVKAVESYAFSPERPDEIYISVSSFNYYPKMAADGVMEWGKEYAVTLRDPVKCGLDNTFFSVKPCDDAPSGNSSSEKIVLPEGCCYVGGDIYPVSYDSYSAVQNGTIKDLCVPSPERANDEWKRECLYIYERLFLNR